MFTSSHYLSPFPSGEGWDEWDPAQNHFLPDQFLQQLNERRQQ